MRRSPPVPLHLKALIHRQFRNSALIPILLIDLVLLALYFSINAYVSANNVSLLRDIAVRSLTEINRRETANIQNTLQAVSAVAHTLQQEHQRFFADLASRPPVPAQMLPNGEPAFATHANGAYFKSEDNGGASLYYSRNAPLTPERKRLARDSELLDPLFRAIINSQPIVAQVYINTPDDMNRIYPPVPDSPSVFGPALEMESFNFFFAADAEHNPERRPVWTESYLDPARQGWMVSCVVPIYLDDELKAVTGLDVTMQTFADKILNLRLPWSGSAFLIDSNSTILAMPPAIEQVLGLQELKDHVYRQVIDSQVLRPEQYNLLQHPDPQMRAQFADILDRASPQVHYLDTAGGRYIVTREAVPATGWQILFLAEESELLAPIRELDRFYKQVGYFAALLMLLFYLLFFAYINRKSWRLADRIAAPLATLARATRDIAKPAAQAYVDRVGIAEIDELGRNFNTMQDELHERTELLVQSRLKARVSQEKARLFEHASLTDKLTGLANRARIDVRLQDELERQKRNGTPWSVIMLDIDHFKRINDTHGHLVGDGVLQDLARRLRNEVRASDLVGRWGGEEFLIVLTDTSGDQALEVAEKIRQEIGSNGYHGVGSGTASMGVSECRPGESIAVLLDRVDEALYQAKEGGRNRSVML